MTAEDFTFAGVEQTLTNGLLTIVSAATVVGLILILILEIALGWNYFKLLLETVERYIVVGVLCYTSPLAFSMGGSKTTSTVFKSWCRMVGSQLLLLVMNVWFLRGFASSMGQFIANGGALTTGKGSIFLWMFCALAYLKCAQRFDSYLASIGLNVAQTGSSMGMELMMAARVISGAGSSVRSAGSVFGRGGNAAATGTGAAANGFASGFAYQTTINLYRPESGTLNAYFKLKGQAIGNLSLTKTTEDGKNLSGWKFGIYSNSACTSLVSGPHTTDSSGRISVTGLTAGTYYVKELGHTNSGIEGLYVCSSTNPQKVTIINGSTASVSFVNKLNTGRLALTKKTDDGSNLSGWRFGIYSDSGFLPCTTANRLSNSL